MVQKWYVKKINILTHSIKVKCYLCCTVIGPKFENAGGGGGGLFPPKKSYDNLTSYMYPKNGGIEDYNLSCISLI